MGSPFRVSNAAVVGLTDRSRPTLRSVADLAGVSPATVSLILNDVAGIRLSAQTRTRVLAAAEQLGYRPNAMARSLRTARSQTIGLVLDTIAGRPGAAPLIAGVQARAWQGDCMLLLAAGAGDDAIAGALVDRLLARQVEGVIYAAGDGFTATKALIDAGHWRIACLGAAPDPAAAARLDGYRGALAAGGLPAEPDLVVAAGATAVDAGRQVLRMMDLRQPPTAIFCLGGRAALGCYDALNQRRLRIPQDVAVVAFDDTGLAAALSPALSAIARPYEEMGRWAADQLLRTTVGPTAPAAAQVRLPGTLVRRQSF